MPNYFLVVGIVDVAVVVVVVVAVAVVAFASEIQVVQV